MRGCRPVAMGMPVVVGVPMDVVTDVAMDVGSGSKCHMAYVIL
jgi:hypothetical protein